VKTISGKSWGAVAVAVAVEENVVVTQDPTRGIPLPYTAGFGGPAAPPGTHPNASLLVTAHLLAVSFESVNISLKRSVFLVKP